MKLIFLPRALEDLEWFRRYYEDVFPEGALRSAKQFAKARQLLVAMPQLGRLIEDPDIRQYAIAGLPSSFIYRIADNRIEILRLWDQRSQPGNDWIDR